MLSLSLNLRSVLTDRTVHVTICFSHNNRSAHVVDRVSSTLEANVLWKSYSF